MNASLPTSAILAEKNLPTADGEYCRLDQCGRHTRWRIRELVAQPRFGAQDEQVTLRLKELGFLPGARLQVIGFGLFGRSPVAVQINGTKFALTPAEAAKIVVETAA